MNILKLQSKKRRIWKNRRSHPNFKQNYKTICSNIDKEITSYYAGKEANLLQKGSDLKHFFIFFNSSIKLKPHIPDIETDGIMLHDNISKAVAFNEFFASVFTVDDGNIPHIGNLKNNLSEINVTFNPESCSESF